jgi:hypothetical protein
MKVVMDRQTLPHIFTVMEKETPIRLAEGPVLLPQLPVLELEPVRTVTLSERPQRSDCLPIM